MTDFPEWETVSILNWIRLVLHKRGYDRWSNPTSVFNASVLPTIQRVERVMFKDLGIDVSDWTTLRPTLSRMINEDPEKVILFIELLIKYVRDYVGLDEYCDFGPDKSRGKNILSILNNSLNNGSKWTVVMKPGADVGLIERVNPKYQEVAEDLGNKHLDQAWYDAFGPDTKPDRAVENTQKAIELTASRAGLTSTKSGVYGALIGDIRTQLDKSYLSIAKPEFDKALSLTTKKDGAQVLPTNLIDEQYADWFWKGLDLIQKANPVRHSSDGVEEFTVSVDAARQSVLIATLACELISKKYIYKSKVANTSKD